MVANLKKMDAALKQRHAAMIKTEQSRYAVCIYCLMCEKKRTKSDV
jgi:hypothetical protein